MQYESLVSLGSRTRALKEELSRNIDELSAELKDIGYGKTRNLSSVAYPQEEEEAEVERIEALRRILAVPDMRPIESHDRRLAAELATCDTPEHSPESLPLILHQFFLSQCEDLLLLKKMHLSRWSRYSRHGAAVTDLHEDFQTRVREIMSQYKDCWHRAHRLEPAHLAFSGGKPAPLHLVTNEDMCFYINWLCWKLSCEERINNFITVVSHITPLHRSRLSKPQALHDDQTAAQWEKWLSGAGDEPFYSSGWRSREKLSRMPESSQSRLGAGRISKQVSTEAGQATSEPRTVLNARIISASASFEASQEGHGLPLSSARLDTYKHRLQTLLESYGIPIDLENLSPSDELELYYQAHRRLKNLLTKQTQMMEFPVSGAVCQEDIDASSVINTFLKPRTWEQALYPSLDTTRQTAISRIRERNTLDELLKSAAAFLHNDSLQEVTKSLKNYVSNIRELPASMRPFSTAAHPSGKDTQFLWKRIYFGDTQSSESLDDKESVSDVTMEDDGVLGALSGRGPQSNGIHGAFSFTPGNLGFGHTGKTSSGKDAHMAYLMLRHIKLRHQRRVCLGILNYFQSVERTINMDLSGNWDKKKDGDVGRADSSFIHNTRIEHIQKMYEYFENGEPENLEDYYSEQEGIPHTQDSAGYYVMYESAIDALKELEKELLLVSTHYVSKDKEYRVRDDEAQNPLPRRNSAFTTSKLLKQPSMVVDLVAYSHAQIDRTAVLLDIWSQEVAFQKNKKKLVDCYMEIYHHVWSVEQKRKIAQAIVNVMYLRPRYDVGAPYFVRAYINECQILAQLSSLTQDMANSMIERERIFCNGTSLGDLNGLTGGLPFSLVEKLPISVTHNSNTLQPTYFLEFCNSLAKVVDVPLAINHSFQELLFNEEATTTGQVLSLHRQVLEACKVEWVNMDSWGNSFSASVHSQVLTGHVTGSPSHLHAIASQHEKNMAAALSTQSRHPSRAALHQQRVAAWANVMEVVLLKSRLHQVLIETDLLTKLYKSQSKELGFEQHHAHIRPVAFESGSTSEAKSSFGTEDDITLDRYVPSASSLALQELDEKDLGTITFSTKESVIKMLMVHGISNVGLALKTQLVQRNNLLIAIAHNHLCFPLASMKQPSRAGRPTSTSKPIKTSDYFVSLQLSQNPIRDNMVKEFVRASVKIGREREKVIALKQETVDTYCRNLHESMAVFSLRVEIARYVKSLRNALEKFPDIRDAHFKIGSVSDAEINPEDEKPSFPIDKHYFKSRPKCLLSRDGKKVVNAFYLPHHLEILGMFSGLEAEERRKALETVLSIVSGVHDICMFMIAYVEMGASKAKLGSSYPCNVAVGADWGGPEAIAHELSEIHLQLSYLQNPTSPQEILHYFEYKRRVFFLEYYFTLAHCIPETFLAKGNERAFHDVSGSLRQATCSVSDTPQQCLHSLLPALRYYSPKQITEALPYRSFATSHGPLPVLYWQCERLPSLLSVGLFQLSEFNRDVANGEVVGVSLLLEDVLHQGRARQDKHLANCPLVPPHQHFPYDVSLFSRLTSNNKRLNGGSSTSSSRVASAVGSVAGTEPETDHNYMSLVDNEPLLQDEVNYVKEPLSALAFLQEFLLMSIRYKQLKQDWGARYLNISRIAESKHYHVVNAAYQQQVLEPALNLLTHVIKRHGYSEEAIKDMSVDRRLSLLTEFDTREAQMMVLLENLESYMLRETCNKIQRDMTLIKAEKLREDGSLPLDLWKTHSAKDTITLPRSDMIQHFANQLLHRAELNGSTFTIDKSWVEECLNDLGRMFMQHEKLTFTTYSSFYESLIKHKDGTITLKEREVSQVGRELMLSRDLTDTTLQTMLIERADDLVIELTALRAKISEMKEEQTFMERNMRKKLRSEYNELVHNMFTTCNTLRLRFDEFKEQLTQECRDSIKSVKMSAIDKMRVVRRESLHGTEDRLSQFAKEAKSVADLERENSELAKLLCKLRSISTWKDYGVRSHYHKKEGTLREQLLKSEREKLELALKQEQELVNVRQDNEAKKTAALNAEREIRSLRRQVDETKREAERRVAALSKEMETLRAEARKPHNYELVVGELAMQEGKVRELETEQEYATRLFSQETTKREKLIKRINYQLNKTTTLKREAFSRVEELQDQLNEYESLVDSSQPVSALTTRPNTTMGSRSRRLQTGSTDPGKKLISRPKSTGLLVKRSVIHGTMF